MSEARESKSVSKRLSKPARTGLLEAYEVSYALTEALLAAMASKGLTRVPQLPEN